MRQSYRCAAFALIGFSVAGSAQQGGVNQGKASTVAPTPATQSVERLVKAGGTIERVRYEAPCREPKSHDQCDLEAQWKAADAAARSAWWAVIQAWLSAAGILGLIFSLYYTRKAVLAAEDATKDAESALKIAERNADAAWNQVEVARESAALAAKTARENAERAVLDSTSSRLAAQAAERAYIYPVLGRNTMMQNRRGEAPFDVELDLVNYGRTPAIITSISAGCDVSVTIPGQPSRSMFAGPSSQFQGEEERQAYPILGAGKSLIIRRISHYSGVSSETYAAGAKVAQAHYKARQSIRENSVESGLFGLPERDPDNPICHYWVWGEITYEDIYRERRTTRFCWALKTPGTEFVAFPPDWNERT